MDIDPEKRTGLLEQAALGGEETIGGLTLRPIVATTQSLYMRLMQTCQEEGPVDSLFQISALVYLHSRPISTLTLLYTKPGQLAAQVLAFMADKTYEDIIQFREWCLRQAEEFDATRTRVESASDSDPKV
jgi:hypothetical protein